MLNKKISKHPFKISEHQLQSSIFKYVKIVLPTLRQYMFAIPNGGARNIIVATKLKKEGVTSGVYDVLISIPNHYKHGLYLECKVGKNGLTDNQKKFRNNMLAIGYDCDVVKSLDEFQAVLCDYFGLEKLTDNEIKLSISHENFIQKGFIGRGLC